MSDTPISIPMNDYMRREAPMRQEYYVDAFRAEMMYIWDGTRFAAPVELEQLCHFRAIAACHKSSPINIKRRRRLLFHYLTEFKAEAEGDLINMLYKQLPVKSMFGKYLNAVCTNYKSAPKRSFGEKGAEDDLFKPLYNEARIDGRFDDAHELARLMNIVALRPVVYQNKLAVDILTPDLFRVEPDPENVHVAKAVWYPFVDGDGETRLKRWTAETIETYARGNGKSVISSEVNPYGIIPFVFLRLRQEDDFYAGGDHDLLETYMETNGMRFYANLSQKYESNGILILTNSGITDPKKATLGPGTVIVRNGITGDPEGELDPKGEWISPSSSAPTTDELRKGRESETLMHKGLPASSLTPNPGMFPSGAARIAERKELNEVREKDGNALATMEAEFKLVMATVWNVDNGAALPVNSIVSTVFQKEPAILEPKDEYELDKTRVTDYVTPVTDFVNKYSPIENEMTEEEVIEYVQKNRELYEKTFKPAPTAPIAPPPAAGDSAEAPEDASQNTDIVAGQDDGNPTDPPPVPPK